MSATTASNQPGTAATHLKQYENLKQLLKTAKSPSGQDLLQHLQEVFKQLILHYPDQALDKLEEVSYLVKHHGNGNIKIEDFLNIEEFRNYHGLSNQVQEYVDKFIAAHFKVSDLKL